MRDKSLLFTVLCVFSWVFFAGLAAVFLVASLYGKWIADLVRLYLPDTSLNEWLSRCIFFTGFLLHAISFTGTILLWKQRRLGYYLVAVPSLLVAAVHLFQPQISWLFTSLYILLIVFFGLYYRKME